MRVKIPADHDDDRRRHARRPPADALQGTGSELRQPLGFAMVGGLALSQALTLYTTPVVYLYLDRLQTFLFGKRKDDHEGAIEAEAAE